MNDHANRFLMQWLRRVYAGDPKGTLGVVVTGLVSTAVSLGLALGPVLLFGGRARALGWIGAMMVVRGASNLLHDRFAEALSLRAMRQLGGDLCRGFVAAPFEVRSRYDTAGFLLLFSQVSSKLEALVRELPKAVLMSIPTLLVLLVAGLVMAPKAVAVSLAVAGVMGPLYWLNSKARAAAGSRVIAMQMASQRRLRELSDSVQALWGMMNEHALRRAVMGLHVYLQARSHNHQRISGQVYAGEAFLGLMLLLAHRGGLGSGSFVQAVLVIIVFHVAFSAVRQLFRPPFMVRELQEHLGEVAMLYAEVPGEEEPPWEGGVSHLALVNGAYVYGQDSLTPVPGLEAMSLGVSPGRLTVITGPNGAGKSTLLRLLSARLWPTSGELRVNGAVVAPTLRRALARRLAYLPQDVALPEMTVQELLEELEQPAGMALVRKLGLLSLLQRASSPDAPELSRGEVQKVLLVRVLLSDADGYFLDEWDTALDADARSVVGEYLRHLARDKIVVSVTHDERLITGQDDHIVLGRRSV